MYIAFKRWCVPLALGLGLGFGACEDAADTTDAGPVAGADEPGGGSGGTGASGGSSDAAGTGGSGVAPAAGTGGSGVAPAAGTGGASGGSSGSADAGSIGDSDAGTPDSELSAAERSSLLFTREEEKLARDVYTQLQDQDRVFDNIAASEQMHMDAIATLLTRYALPDPAADKAAGAFTDGTLQALYDRMVEQGGASALAAIGIGLEIEELDIRDLQRALDDVTHGDIQLVYEQLMRGSRNHLRAFYSRLNALGGTYEPTYLDNATFEEIATSDVEMGP